MTTYTIENFQANGEQIMETQLTAKTDVGARRQAANYMKTASFGKSDVVKLCWFRTDDHCRGTLETLKGRE